MFAQRPARAHQKTTRKITWHSTIEPSTPSPASASASCAAQHTDDKQEQHGSDSGINDRRDNPGSEVDVELRQQPAAEESSSDSYEQVTENSKSYPPHQVASQPSCNDTHCNYDNQAFI